MYKSILASTLMLAVSVPALAGDGAHISATATVNAEHNQRVSHRTYEVYYYGDRKDSRREVMDRALYKAAKKTLDKGYEWFRIVDREAERDVRSSKRSSVSGGFYTVPERQCGLLTCSTRSRTYYRGGIESGFLDREDTVYTVILEIELGEGYVSNTDDVYDARMVKNSYR